jgi:Ca2+-binding EF-hand superfamily protein
MNARLLFLVLLIGMVAMPAAAQEIAPPPPDRPQADRDRGRNDRDRGRNDWRSRWMKQFDKDGDGRFNAEERQAMTQARKQYQVLSQIPMPQEQIDALRKAADADGNGELDGREYRTLFGKMREAQEKHREAMLKKYDADENGVLDDKEIEQIKADQRKAEFDKMDTNGDGNVTLVEFEAAKAAEEKKDRDSRAERDKAWRAMRDARRNRDNADEEI